MLWSKKTEEPTPSTVVEVQPSTETPVEASVDKKEAWNDPKANISRIAATYVSFLFLGMSNSSYGVLIAQLEEFYHVSHLAVSLLFITPIAGFLVSTFMNHSLHACFGRRGIAMISATSQLIAYTIACLHPPFFVLIIGYIFVGLGEGAKNASWNSYISGLDNANEYLGFLHAFFGLGATILPLLVSFLFKSGWHWYMVYYIFLGIVGFDLLLSTWAFREHSAHVYLSMYEMAEQATSDPEPAIAPPAAAKEADTTTVERKPPSKKSGTRLTIECAKHKAVIIPSLFLLSYVGSEVSLGGWLVTFLMDVRHGSEFKSGVVSSGFWAGITVGRVVLSFVTNRVFNSETNAALAYIILSIVMQLLFWLIPNFVVSAICVSFLGFFLGPLFPCIIMAMSKLLPKSLRTVAIGICAAIGASGASVVPFMVGAIANARGVQALQPIILACLVICLALCIVLKRLPPLA